jgi:hypothetical protein
MVKADPRVGFFVLGNCIPWLRGKIKNRHRLDMRALRDHVDHACQLQHAVMDQQSSAYLGGVLMSQR